MPHSLHLQPTYQISAKKTTKKQKNKPKVTALAGIDLDARRCLMKSFIK